MKKSWLISIIVLVGLCTLAPLAVPARAEAGPVETVILYVPNRIFDLVDIFRVRLRVGPGISAGVRATRPLSAFAGFHSSAFIGLPGPRGKKTLPLPVGFDLRSGAQLSVANVSDGTPYYDPLEVGFEIQPFIVGANVGIGVWEILDFATGFLLIDLVGDDLGRGSKDDEIEDAVAEKPEEAASEAVEPEAVETEAVEPEA